MGHRALIVFAVLAGIAGGAHAADPVRSAGCTEAMKTLQAAEDRALDARKAGSEVARQSTPRADREVEALRREAARACLGGPDAPLIPHRYVSPPPAPTSPATLPARPSMAPQERAPTVLPLPAASPPLRPPAVAPEARPPGLPTVITSCDGLGCWTSNGTWMPQAGPNLQSPRGPCTMQGLAVSCP